MQRIHERIALKAKRSIPSAYTNAQKIGINADTMCNTNRFIVEIGISHGNYSILFLFFFAMKIELLRGMVIHLNLSDDLKQFNFFFSRKICLSTPL